MKFKIIPEKELPQRSEAWHSFRKGKIGASMAAAILGISPWQTKLQLFESMILGGEKEITPAMQRGMDLEKDALAWFCSTKYEFKPCVVQSLDFPELFTSLDGYCEFKNVHVEIKCPTSKIHEKVKEEMKVPSYYYAQMQHQMMILGSDIGYYFSFDGMSGFTIDVPRNEEYIKALIAQELQFLDDLRNFKAPEPSDMDTKTIIDSELVSASRKYRDLQNQKEMIESEMEAIKREMIGACTHPSTKIGDLKISKVIRKGNVDYSKMVNEYNIDQEKYRKSPIEMWRIS